MGRWMSTHGQAIYQTRGGPFLPTPQATSTRRDNVVFLHVLPDEHDAIASVIKIPRLPAGPELESARLLVEQTPVTFRTAGDVIEIDVPARTNGSPTQVIELTYSGSVMKVDPLPLP
jgi:alpha-L-fucosidase